jgi:hypothetical protein
MLIEELTKILEFSWNKNTCSPSMQVCWNESNKAFGQCAVTALIVNDFLGGKIMRCMCESGSHYYNLINGNIVDLTSSQFNEIPNYTKGEERTREYLLSNKDTKKRYRLLLNKVKDNFVKYGTKKYTLLDVNGQYFSKVPGTCGGNKKLKIYGKLDCPSAMRYLEKSHYKDNRVFFESVEVAIKLGYRPCAKCMKKEYEKWKHEK